MSFLNSLSPQLFTCEKEVIKPLLRNFVRIKQEMYAFRSRELHPTVLPLTLQLPIFSLYLWPFLTLVLPKAILDVF